MSAAPQPPDGGGGDDVREVQRIGAGELRAFIADADELKKGTLLFDGGALSNLARYQNKLYCDAKGSSPAPYKVTLAWSETPVPGFKGRCSCPVRAFNKPFCKHAAALLVAWARAPEAFVVSDTAPAGAGGSGGGGARKREVKKGSSTAAELMKTGVEQVGTLVRELGVSGVAAIGPDRVAQIEALAAGLRENKLRRLSARTLDLAALLRGGATGPGGGGRRAIPSVAYTNLMTDLLLTARKLEKHLAGEPLDDRHVEELIGKTWQKADRKPVEKLELIEIAFGTRTTSDDFVITESRFFDLASGRHYSEKLILPAFRAKMESKRSHGGQVLAGARGTTYPGYPPSRVEFSDLGDRRPLDAGALSTLLERALPDVGAALAALHEHRKDVFAPDLVPVAVRIDTLFARGARLQAVDEQGGALHLPDDAALEEQLAGSLREARLCALIGDVGIDAALPTLWPLAAVIEGPLGLELRPLAPPGAAVRAAPGSGAEGAAWVSAAREAGASTAAVALGEVREELADAFATGLTGLGARVAEPLAERLRELGLEKQAALLQGLVKRPEPAERLDDFIKLYQVLEIALVRLAGATHVDRAATERVPTYESVSVGRPEERLTPAEVTRRRAAGTMNRYLAAVHHARYYEALPAEELAAHIFPTWADGSATPFIAKTFAGRGVEAIRAAEKALTTVAGRVAKRTAVRVLHAVAAHGGAATAEAAAVLGKVAKHAQDAGLKALALDALDALDAQRAGGSSVRERRAASLQKVHELETVLRMAPHKDERSAVIKALVELGDLAAIPVLRQAFYSDASRTVRDEAAHALGELGDTEMVETFVRRLAGRGQDDKEAKVAAYALGYLGDVRGLDELLAAYAEGYKPGIVADAIRAFGPVALEPLVDLIEGRPELAKRAAALDVLKKMDDTAVAECLLQRLEARRDAEDVAAVAQLYLKLAEVHPHSKREVARAVQARFGGAEGKDAPKDAQAALKAAQRALGIVKRSK